MLLLLFFFGVIYVIYLLEIVRIAISVATKLCASESTQSSSDSSVGTRALFQRRNHPSIAEVDWLSGASADDSFFAIFVGRGE